MILQNQLHPLIFIIRILLLHTDFKQLIFQPFLRYHKIYQSKFRWYFRGEMRVSQFRRHKQLEILRIIDNIVSHLYTQHTCILKRLSTQNRVEHRVYLFFHVFNYQTLTELNSCFQNTHEIAICLFHNRHLIVLLVLPHPTIRLKLRVNHKRPSPRVVSDYPVVSWKTVRR